MKKQFKNLALFVFTMSTTMSFAHNERMSTALLLTRMGGMNCATNQKVNSYEISVFAHNYKVLRCEPEWLESKKYKCTGKSNTAHDIKELKRLFRK